MTQRGPVATAGRRGVLRGALAVGALAAVPGAGVLAAQSDFEGFMALSRSLTGFDDLDREIGRKIHDLLDADGKLAALPKVGRDLEVAIVLAWYGGIVETAAGPRLVAYQDALMWRSLDFATPGGECGGAFGHWAEASEDKP